MAPFPEDEDAGRGKNTLTRRSNHFNYGVLLTLVFCFCSRIGYSAEQKPDPWGSQTATEQVTLCGVELSDPSRVLLPTVEVQLGKKVRSILYKDSGSGGFATISPDGTPVIGCEIGVPMNEELIVHELFHLQMRLKGFPSTQFEGISREVSKSIHAALYDPIQHWIYYPILRSAGFAPDTGRRNEVRKILSKDRFEGQAIPEPLELIANYFTVAMEVDDPSLLAEFDSWYKRKNWNTFLETAKSLVQIIIDSNPKSPEQSIEALVSVINRFFEDQRVTFHVERWEEQRLGPIVGQHVVIRGVSSGNK